MGALFFLGKGGDQESQKTKPNVKEKKKGKNLTQKEELSTNLSAREKPIK